MSWVERVCCCLMEGEGNVVIPSTKLFDSLKAALDTPPTPR